MIGEISSRVIAHFSPFLLESSAMIHAMRMGIVAIVGAAAAGGSRRVHRGGIVTTGPMGIFAAGNSPAKIDGRKLAVESLVF